MKDYHKFLSDEKQPKLVECFAHRCNYKDFGKDLKDEQKVFFI